MSEKELAVSIIPAARPNMLSSVRWDMAPRAMPGSAPSAVAVNPARPPRRASRKPGGGEVKVCTVLRAKRQNTTIVAVASPRAVHGRARA
jgi:hypothetical protein